MTTEQHIVCRQHIRQRHDAGAEDVPNHNSSGWRSRAARLSCSNVVRDKAPIAWFGWDDVLGIHPKVNHDGFRAWHRRGCWVVSIPISCARDARPAAQLCGRCGLGRAQSSAKWAEKEDFCRTVRFGSKLLGGCGPEGGCGANFFV